MSRYIHRETFDLSAVNKHVCFHVTLRHERVAGLVLQLPILGVQGSSLLPKDHYNPRAFLWLASVYPSKYRDSSLNRIRQKYLFLLRYFQLAVHYKAMRLTSYTLRT
jgi:hypothetical protein